MRRETQHQQMTTAASNLELATFWVADQWLGIPLADVIEAVVAAERAATSR